MDLVHKVLYELLFVYTMNLLCLVLSAIMCFQQSCLYYISLHYEPIVSSAFCDHVLSAIMLILHLFALYEPIVSSALSGHAFTTLFSICSNSG